MAARVSVSAPSTNGSVRTLELCELGELCRSRGYRRRAIGIGHPVALGDELRRGGPTTKLLTARKSGAGAALRSDPEGIPRGGQRKHRAASLFITTHGSLPHQ